MTPQVSLYANYIEALSAGDTAPQTANGLPVVNHGESLAPYVSKQKEVGVKFEHDGLGGGLALFPPTSRAGSWAMTRSSALRARTATAGSN